MSTFDWTDNGFRKKGGPGELPDNSGNVSEVIERAESVPDEQERLSKHDKTVYWGPGVSIPGFGKSGPGCGEVRPTAVCNECGETEFGPHVCGRRTCPDCWGSWAKDSGTAATQRIQAERLTQPPNHRRQLGHFILSLAEMPTTRQELLDLRSEAAEVAKEKGVRGLMTVLHPWRVLPSVKADYEAADPHCGVWVWLREEYGDNWREAVYKSPHVHVIGLMTPNMEAGEGNDVWHLIDTLSPLEGAADRESHNEVYGLVRYLLSHAAVPTEKGQPFNTRTWAGDLAGAVFSPEEELPEETYTRLQRAVEEVAAGAVEESEVVEYREEQSSLEEGVCPCEDCSGVLIDVMRADEYLRQADPPPEAVERLEICYELRMGRIQAPAGLRHPTTVEECQELLEELAALQ